MACFADGKVINGGGSPINMLYDDAVETGLFSTASGSYVTVTGSSLIVPAGTWALHYSIELAADGYYANLCGAQFYNATAALQIAQAREPLYDNYGWDLKGGVYHATFGAPQTLLWQIRVVVGIGSVGARKARILAVEDI